MIQLGRFQIELYNFGDFRLDGGAMFGSVPKNLWSRRIACDEDNCIRLATNSLVIADGERRFLLDVGLGDKWNEKSRKIFDISYTPLSKESAASITDIVLTHLHFDHAGGISHYADSGDLVLTYPKARVHLQHSNLETAQNPNPKERASYLKENVEILAGADVALLKGSGEIYPGISVHEVHGHTAGQQYIELQDGGESLIFPTDVIPTSHHVPLPFTMGYDICAETILREKQELLEKAVAKRSLVVFQHDTTVKAARIGKDEKGGFQITETLLV
ncbi:MAG: MBL fold metallo-hydrolase [Deltaproteobacteria bacterium]|nr:MBL fold metallo-hydrolase [Deltaproteobacteria bacterium]